MQHDHAGAALTALLSGIVVSGVDGIVGSAPVFSSTSVSSVTVCEHGQVTLAVGRCVHLHYTTNSANLAMCFLFLHFVSYIFCTCRPCHSSLAVFFYKAAGLR